MIHIGIDPGADGAIATISEDGSEISTDIFPRIGGVKTPIDFVCLDGMIKLYNEKKVHFVLEKPGIISKIGKTSMAKLYMNCGLIEGILIGNGCRYTLVPPKEWQKEMWQGVSDIRKPSTKLKKNGTKALGEKDTKAMALIAAKRLWPSMTFHKSDRAYTPHDGIVDALLMAEYSRRKF